MSHTDFAKDVAQRLREYVTKDRRPRQCSSDGKPVPLDRNVTYTLDLALTLMSAGTIGPAIAAEAGGLRAIEPQIDTLVGALEDIRPALAS